jgi:hypothetical protein
MNQSRHTLILPWIIAGALALGSSIPHAKKLIQVLFL